MINQFEGPATEVHGAKLENLRLTEDGFRVECHLSPDFRVAADHSSLGLAELSPGSYLISFDGHFVVKPLTPPYITLDTGDISLDPPAPGYMTWTTVQATLHNQGLQDVNSMVVRLYATLEGASPVLLTEEDISLPGNGKYTLVHSWNPTYAGVWAIHAEIDSETTTPADVTIGPFAPARVNVEAERLPKMLNLASQSDAIRLTWPVALLLSSTALAAMSILGIVLKHGRKLMAATPTSDER